LNGVHVLAKREADPEPEPWFLWGLKRKLFGRRRRRFQRRRFHW